MDSFVYGPGAFVDDQMLSGDLGNIYKMGTSRKKFSYKVVPAFVFPSNLLIPTRVKVENSCRLIQTE